MGDNKKCDIFISYRRDGGDMTAMYIYQELKERKYDVFYDLEVLRAGKFNDSLLEYIASCKDFVLVLSPKALDRCGDENDWVRKEIAEALRLKKNIIPIMMKGFVFPEHLPDEIDDVRYQNGLTATTEYFKESMNRLCDKYLLTKPKKNSKIPVIAGVSLALVVGSIAGGKMLLDSNSQKTVVPVETEAQTELAPVETEAVTEKVTEVETEASTEKVTEAQTELVVTTPVSDTDWPIMRHDSPWALYDGKYVCQSPDLEVSAMGEVSNMPVFQNEAVLRKDVASVTFLNTLKDAGEDAWDISEAQDGSVLAWTQKNGDLFDLYIAGEGGVRAPEDCPGLFSMYRNASAIEFNGFLDTSENQNFTCFFEGCTSLKELDLRSLDTSSARGFNSFVCVCPNLTSLDVSKLDTSRATDMHGMFSQLYALKTLDVSNFDTSHVSDMAGMFMDAHKLKTLTFGDGFDTSRVKSMEGMFWADSNLSELDVSGFDTSKVQSMEGMFWGCSGLLELDVSNFDTSNVESMTNMFGGRCESLLELDVSGFDTSKVEYMNSMFEGCTNLTTLDVSGFDTSSLKGMEMMFYDGFLLEDLDVSGFDTSNVESMQRAFAGCLVLENLDLTGWNTEKVTDTTLMFEDCKELQWKDPKEGLLYEQYLLDKDFWEGNGEPANAAAGARSRSSEEAKKEVVEN